MAREFVRPWEDFIGREIHDVDERGRPVVIRVTGAEQARPAPERDPSRLRMPGWSADPDAPVRRVKAEPREDPERAARRRERLRLRLDEIEAAKRRAAVNDEERNLRAELAKLEATL